MKESRTKTEWNLARFVFGALLFFCFYLIYAGSQFIFAMLIAGVVASLVVRVSVLEMNSEEEGP